MDNNKIIIGIYSIVNIENKRTYVGQSINIYLRWKQHRYALNQDKHPNYYLQNDWNTGGIKNFQFNVLEICESDKDLNDREVYWGKFFNCNDSNYGYNINKCGGSVRRDQEELRKKRLKYEEELKRIDLEVYNIVQERKKEALRQEKEKLRQIELEKQRNIYRKEIEEKIFKCLEEERLREEIKDIQRLPLSLYLQKLDELVELMGKTGWINLLNKKAEIKELRNKILQN